MDLLKLELEQKRLPKDFLSQLKPISKNNISKFNVLTTTFDQTIRSVFASPNEDLFNTGLDLLTEYSELDEIDFKDYIMAADGDDYEDFADNFYSFKDYVFSKDGVRGLTSADWVAGVSFTYRPSEGVLEVYSPDEGDLGVIKISPSTQAKLSDLVKKASTMSAGKTFFTDGSGEFVIGK
jgi:hypothetical protein